MRKILTWIKGLFIKIDETHPLNDAIVKLTSGKTFDFATGKLSVVNGYGMVKGVRQNGNVNYVDVFVKITQDEPKRFYKSEIRRRKFRLANVRYYLKKSDLKTTLRIVGMKSFQIGKVTFV